MKTITVHTSRQYQVLIERGVLSQLGTYAAQLKTPGKAAIISDSNVWPIYGQIAESSLVSAGFEVLHHYFPAGEVSKNADTYLDIVNFLADNKLTRSDLIIALGGGVVGDVTGFAAATYLRGVAYIQIPTTLLAMVDSSVGGKTAIDLPAGKNLLGAFYQPSLVLCDPDTLNTLPEEIFRDGCAEVIKYGVLYDNDLFSHLLQKGLAFDRESVIARCVELKKNVVTADEFDLGERQKLNLGHTIGHGVEAGSSFTISHGQAVAIGMAIIARAACALSICDKNTAEQIHAILTKFSLSSKSPFNAKQLFDAALSDKKRAGDTVNLIVPETIGRCIIRPTPVSQLLSVIEAGLT